MIFVDCTVGGIFAMDTGFPEEMNCNPAKLRLAIPLYQRGYRYTDENLRYILKRFIFTTDDLGSMTLEETEERYEVVTGDNQLTTWFLMLAALYNCAETPEKRQELYKILCPFGRVVLEDDTLGPYLFLEEGKVVLRIDPERDIYGQARLLRRAFFVTQNYFATMRSARERNLYQRNLLNSKVHLILQPYPEPLPPLTRQDSRKKTVDRKRRR